MYMKHILVILTTTFITLAGCGKEKGITSSNNVPHYNEVEELHIEWNDLFNQNNDSYYAYVYSVTCTPCSMLREQVTSFSKGNYVNFYFVFPNDDIPFVNDENTADASLGKNNINDVYIYNTPTLIGITNKTITSYSRDYYEIKSFIESYTNGEN